MAASWGEDSRTEMDEHEALMSTTDVALLKRAWRNEKAAPEILHYEEALVKRAREQIQLMEETVEEFEGSGVDPLSVSLYQMDLDRTQFLLRSYLRVRLQKIESCIFHILKTEEVENRLSDLEKMFARRCSDDMENHLEETVLSQLPDNYQSAQKQSVISEEDDMVPKPQLDTFVVGKCIRPVGPMLLDNSDNFEMLPGEQCILRYQPFKEEVERGNIDLV